jgi:hypothetical protein
VYNKNEIIISDTENKCIRSFDFYKNNINTIVISNSLQDIYPTKIVLDRKKDILYYLSRKYLRSINLSNKKNSILYNGDIKSIELNNQNKVYILETISE